MSNTPKKSLSQKFLDNFYYFRRWMTSLITYIAFRIYGLEVSFEQIRAGYYANRQIAGLNLDNVVDLDQLKEFSMRCFEEARERRTVVVEKCKTLLTLSTLLLALIGALLPKYLEFDGIVLKLFSIVGIGGLLVAVILLVVFFGVGSGRVISLGQSVADSDANNLKKFFINENLECQADTDNRTDYLVNVYEVSRFCFLSAFVIFAALFMVNFFTQSPSDQTESVIRAIRSDEALINFLRGPQGKVGERGVKGDNGERGTDAVINENEIVDSIFRDPRLIKMLKETSNRTPTQQ